MKKIEPLIGYEYHPDIVSKLNELVGFVNFLIGQKEKEEKEEKDWTPKDGEKYWFIYQIGVGCDEWMNTNIHNARKNFLGIYKTKEEAETALAKIKENLPKILGE